jgi:hypothetical protein
MSEEIVMNVKLRMVLILVCLGIAACDKPAPVRPTPPPNQTWIDAPLHGSTLPMGTHTIAYHAAGMPGIESFEVRVDGALIDAAAPQWTGPGGAPFGTLFYGETPWTPAAPGTYLISVRSKNSGGPFGSPAQVQVTVESDLQLQAVTQPALVTATQPGDLQLEFITPTTTPTAAPTATPTPAPANAGFPDPEFSSETFYYRGASCGPKDVTIQVEVEDPEIYSVVLFFRLKNMDSGETTAWTDVPMNAMGGGLYSHTLQSEADIPDFARFPKATLQVQIVATAQNGSEVGRTEVLSEVTLEACSAL